MVQEMDELHTERDHLQANLTETHKELLDMQQAYEAQKSFCGAV